MANMADIDLTQAFERAEALYAFLTEHHPLDPATSDKLQKRIDTITSPERRERLTKLKDFLSTYHIGDMKGKPARHWDHQINLITQLVRDFLHTKPNAQPTVPALMEYMIDITGDDLRLHFNHKAQENELSYEAVYARASQSHGGKPHKVPAEAQQRHDFTYGDRRSLHDWLKSPASREVDSLAAKIDYYKDRHQYNAVADIVEGLAPFRWFLPRDLAASLSKKPRINPEEISYARQLDWQNDLLLGITQVFGKKEIADNFTPETYKKIRRFLAHEMDDIRELNRSAALMTLVFPEYKDFTKYILNKSKYNPDTQTLNLDQLIDTSNFEFQDNDYQAWGELLLDQGPSRFFYLKTAHLLDSMPRNAQGKILIGQLDRQLYDKIADLVGFCSQYDCSRYSELKIVADILSIQKFKSDCRADTADLPDKVSTIPDIHIDGSRFGKPGYHFGRLSYEDDRFFVVGRFTKSCEYIDGDWGATIREGYRNRASTYYCLFDPNDRIIAHTWVYMDAQDWDKIILDGFEADQNNETVSKALLERIVEEMNKEDTHKTFIVGTSAAHIGLEQIKTIKRGEEQDNHVKTIHPEDLLDLKRLIENAKLTGPQQIRHANPSDDDSDALKAATRPAHLYYGPKDPKAP